MKFNPPQIHQTALSMIDCLWGLVAGATHSKQEGLDELIF